MLSLLKKHDPESAQALESFFDSFGWPVPKFSEDRDEREYYVAAGGRFLVFLTDYGLVLRITPERGVFRAENPHFLQSLFHRAAGQYRIDLDPGYDCPVPKDEYRAIYQAFREKYGIVVEDMKPHNLAYVPGTRYPVAIDLDSKNTRVNPRLIAVDQAAAARLAENCAAVKIILEKDELKANPQIDIYRPLRGIIREAWPAEAVFPDPAGISDFKKTCRAFKEAGTLLAPWADEKNDYWGTTQAASNYARALKKAGAGPV